MRDPTARRSGPFRLFRRRRRRRLSGGGILSAEEIESIERKTGADVHVTADGLVVLHDRTGVDSPNPGLARLIHSVEILARDAQGQIDWLWAIHPDELAIIFDDEYQQLDALQRDGVEFSREAISALKALDAQLEAMSGQPMSGREEDDLWTTEAIRARPEWDRVRALARQALPLLPINE